MFFLKFPSPQVQSKVLIDLCIIVFNSWMHNDLEIALVGSNVDLTYTYQVSRAFALIGINGQERTF